jgi:hypothetical protein
LELTRLSLLLAASRTIARLEKDVHRRLVRSNPGEDLLVLLPQRLRDVEVIDGWEERNDENGRNTSLSRWEIIALRKMKRYLTSLHTVERSRRAVEVV